MKRTRSDADRRLRQANRFARVLRVLEFIQGRGRYDARALAVELECSERTVYRDLNVLELAGVPWTFDEAARAYRVRPDFRFPVLPLTDDELVGQATATVLTATPGLNVGPGARPTTQKLKATSKDEVSQLLSDAEQVVAVLDLKLADHTRHREAIRTAQWALLKRKQLVGQYHSPYEPRPVKVTLHPYRLVLVKQAWYLLARPVEAAQPRTYRITRFQSLRTLDTAAEVPCDFDLKAYFGNAWGVYRGEPTYDVEIEFSPEAAPLVTETTWHPTQRVQGHRDGRATLFFRVDGLNEIVYWLLGWSGRAKVIRPPALQALLVKELRTALARYACPGPK